MLSFLPIIVILTFLVLISAAMYNSLVGKKNQCENAFASIDVYLKKRYDLLPNLVNTVKQYMKHEADVLTKITEMRAKAVSGNISSDEAVGLNNALGKAIGGIMVAVENYPDLKASGNFQLMQRSLNEIEEQIAASRRAFNAAVTAYNNSVEMFPTSIIAGMMNYKRRQLFEIEDRERQNTDVGQLFNS